MHEMCEKFCTGPAKVIGALALVTLILFLGTLSFYFSKKTSLLGRADTIRDTFSVSGHGEVTAVPDIALITAGLETTGRDIAALQKENTEKMNGFLAKVATLGVDEKDKKTTSYSIRPDYEYEKTGTQKLVGYTVFNQVQLKVRDTEKISTILGLLGQYGLNQVGSFSFDIDDKSILKSEALDKALKDARDKAERVAQSANIHLGKLVSFWENGAGYTPGPIPYGVGGDSALPMYAAKAPSVEQGSRDVTVDINATYEILP